jgi:hypothetical protein
MKGNELKIKLVDPYTGQTFEGTIAECLKGQTFEGTIAECLKMLMSGENIAAVFMYDWANIDIEVPEIDDWRKESIQLGLKINDLQSQLKAEKEMVEQLKTGDTIRIILTKVNKGILYSIVDGLDGELMAMNIKPVDEVIEGIKKLIANDNLKP